MAPKVLTDDDDTPELARMPDGTCLTEKKIERIALNVALQVINKHARADEAGPYKRLQQAFDMISAGVSDANRGVRRLGLLAVILTVALCCITIVFSVTVMSRLRDVEVKVQQVLSAEQIGRLAPRLAQTKTEEKPEVSP